MWELLVVEQAGKIVAYVELWRTRNHGPSISSAKTIIKGILGTIRSQPSTHGILQDIYVAPLARQQGLASTLISDSHCWFQRVGVRNVNVTIWQDNHASQQLAQKFGYEITSVLYERSLD